VTRLPRVSLFWPNGGWPDGKGADFRYASPRKVEGGFARDTGLRIAQGEHLFKPYSVVGHGDRGWNDPANMELDSWPMTKADPRWARLADVDEYVAARMVMIEACQWEGHELVYDEYFGSPEGSSILTKAWATNRGAWANRVDSCFKPLLKLRERMEKLRTGITVRGFLDMGGQRDANSQTAAVIERARTKHRLVIGVEGMIRTTAAPWVNKPDIPVMTHERTWEREDPEKYGDHPGNIRKSEMLGEQIVIVTERDEDVDGKGVKTSAQRCLTLLRQGTSVAVIGLPFGYPTAGSLQAAATATKV
jgi:hypothetical protein